MYVMYVGLVWCRGSYVTIIDNLCQLPTALVGKLELSVVWWEPKVSADHINAVINIEILRGNFSTHGAKMLIHNNETLK